MLFGGRSSAVHEDGVSERDTERDIQQFDKAEMGVSATNVENADGLC
jgi:hypothetical protein